MSNPPGFLAQPAPISSDPSGCAPRGILDDLDPQETRTKQVNLPCLQAVDSGPLSDVVDEWVKRRKAAKEALLKQMQQEKASIEKVINDKKAEIQELLREYKSQQARTNAGRGSILECRNPERLTSLLRDVPRQRLFNSDSQPSTTIVFIQTLLQTKLPKPQVCGYLFDALGSLDWDNPYVSRRRHVIHEAISMYLGDQNSPEAKNVSMLLMGMATS